MAQIDGDPNISGVPTPPDGVQSMSTHDNAAHDAYVYQNTGVQIQAGTYTLSLYIRGGAGAMTYIEMFASDTPTGAMDASQYLIVQDSLVYPTYDWTAHSFTATVDNGSPLIGKYLCPTLRTYYGWTGYDMVSLTGPDVIPEPTSLLLLGSGLAALMGTVVRRRRS